MSEDIFAPFKVKIKTSRWWYKELVGKEVEVVKWNKSGAGKKIPIMAKGEIVFATEHEGRTKYIHPDDVLILNNNIVNEANYKKSEGAK